MTRRGCTIGAVLVGCLAATCSPLPRGSRYTNSIGMELVRIEAGTFWMGESSAPLPAELTEPLTYPSRTELQGRFPFGDPNRFQINLEHVRHGDFDEKPLHQVTLSRPFFLGVHEVTNAQYEQFDPEHRALRGGNGFSKDDDEAVVFVTWAQAKAFCDWLSRKEGRPYRLPTEAEWEYAARAGTTTAFFTGDRLPEAFHKNARRTSFDQPEVDVVSLRVGETPSNPWGLYDMHGNVEEWVYDWYGPYPEGPQVDPVGRAEGDFRVTRGGSHGTNLYYLRSANRMGTLPENRHWLIGFRVVLGELPESTPLPAPPPQLFQQRVRQEVPADLARGPDREQPYFKGPRKYVKIPVPSNGPVFSHHNHDPAITECPNGDLLAIWYTCVEERGRELAIAASRLRYGQQEWDPASLFWDTPDRNDHCPALWFDGDQTLYHFNGLSTAGRWEPLAIVMRTSQDNGASWSKARLIAPEHGFRQMVGEPVFRLSSGALAVGADAGGGSTLWISRDQGQSWSDAGGTINGIHAGIAQLRDGRILALGRGQNIQGMMPQSISADEGRSWQASASVFPPLRGGQRPVLLRLAEGPLFFASYSDDLHHPRPGEQDRRARTSLFGALSYDEGKTWPVRRIITSARQDQAGETIDGGPMRFSPTSSEPQGYLSVCQTADGVIQLITSINHYAFNQAWLEEQTPPPGRFPRSRTLPSQPQLAHFYGADQAPGSASPSWNFLSQSLEESRSVQSPSPGLLRIRSAEGAARWSNERRGGFPPLTPKTGFTAEVRVRVSDSRGNEGFDFEAFAPRGPLIVNHYRIRLTTGGVYYWDGNRLVALAEGIDNRRALHTYRLAVREDTAVQIYRDGRLLSVQPADLQIGWRTPTRGSLLEWGSSSPSVEATLDHVSYDPSGAYQP